MPINISELDNVYSKYGYKKKATNDNLRVYLYEEGRYFGVDIIPIKNNSETESEIEKIRKEYADGGYAVQIRKINNIDEAADELYKSFFAYQSTLKRLKSKYKLFSKNQTKLNGGTPYKYINSQYQINNENPSTDIITEIRRYLRSSSPQLIIIEAAAGYGKTCTSYEILNSLTNNGDCANPIMTELSRNRGANIFRYILLDEIDREYPNLDSKLVKHEIQSGRIPLIIDGFDELLHKSDLVSDQEHEVFGEVEPMLDTIGKMLTGKAKLILTTRKTAIFGGSEFRDWFKRWKNAFQVNRFTIEIPRIKDWLGKERVNEVKEKNIPIDQIANPVLLTYLRNLTKDDFNNHLLEPDLIVQKYFFSLMEREKARQELYIDPYDQYQIFKNVVKMLIQFDLSSEKKQFMRDVIEDENRKILEKALKAYPGSPSIDTISDKLINHAILDRKGREENQVGFINDFVFGNFIGEIMCETSPQEIENNFSAYMVELGATAFRVQNSANKKLLWDKVELLKHKFPTNVLFNFDVTLRGKLLRPIKGTTVTSIQAYQVFFDESCTIDSTVFISCKFKKCKFQISAFKGSTFIQCHFDSCEVIGGDYLDYKTENSSISCTETDCNIFYYNSRHFLEEEYTADEIFQNEILKKIYELESKHRTQKLLHLIKEYDKAKRKTVQNEIQNLAKNGYLVVNGMDVHLSMNKLEEVKKRIK
ncbi:hypothetical protein [Ekhidna sp.]|uniref:hypothetical protein n=1 Tax=Ekhidna sp. TaxID=2608089 RepID=UPI003B5943FB